jgi:hypothetical protein
VCSSDVFSTRFSLSEVMSLQHESWGSSRGTAKSGLGTSSASLSHFSILQEHTSTQGSKSKKLGDQASQNKWRWVKG